MRARTWPSVSSGTLRSEHLGQRAQDLPVLLGLARREHRELAALQPALGVDPARVLLGVGGTRQDHVGRLGAAVAVMALVDHERLAEPRRCRARRRRSGTRPRSRRPAAPSRMPATSRPPWPGTRPRSRPPTRAAAVCSTLKPFQSSLTRPKLLGEARRARLEHGRTVGPGQRAHAQDQHRLLGLLAASRRKPSSPRARAARVSVPAPSSSTG